MSETEQERKARLAQALRDNLRRRKAQARAGSASTATSRHHLPDGDDPSG